MKEINDIDFDQQIKELLDSSNEPIDSSVEQTVWKGIESGLNRRNTFTLVYKSAGLLAIAASLLIGIFLIMPDYNNPSKKYEYSNDLAVIHNNKPSIDQSISQIGQLKPSSLMAFNHSKKNTLVGENTSNEQINEAKASRKDIYISQGEETVLNKEQSAISDDNANKHQVINANKGNVENQTGVEAKDLEEANISNLDNVQLRYEDDSLFVEEEENVKSQLINIGIYSNAGIGILDDPTDFSSPSYAPGSEHAMRNSGIIPISERPEHAMPISIGAQVHFRITDELMIGTGINFTYLYSKYEALVDNMTSQDVVRQKLYYLGIPANLYYNILQNKNVTFYANAGFMVEKGLKAQFNLKDLQNNYSTRSSDIDPLQWSINAGIGFEYKLFPKIGLYLDPSISYYFDNDQPYSIRTEEPLQLKADIGVRFHF